MRVLVFGASGIVGRATVAAAAGRGWPVAGRTHAECDLTDADTTARAIAAEAPELVVNCAAFTQVDRCESEPERAFAVNAEGAGQLAVASAAAGARLIQISSDYVFDGRSRTPYREDAPTAPQSVYGASKLEGERRTLAQPGTLVVRTSWVFGSGGANFVDTNAGRLRRREGPLRVVADQIGAPTFAPFLARALLDLGESAAAGIVHYRNREPASWFELARAIAAEIDPAAQIVAATTDEVPRAARRPAWSVLDVGLFEARFGRQVERWRDGLRQHFAGDCKENE